MIIRYKLSCVWIFGGLRRELRDMLDGAVGGSAPQHQDLHIVCYCRKGAHRSTGIGFLTQYALKQDDVMRKAYNLRINPMRHMSKEAGVWEQDYCGERVKCRQLHYKRTGSS